jgi:ATP-dependent Clp protease ATP-binding subunit ClpC
MTSNIGARQLADFGTGVGFGTKAREESRDENAKTVIQNALRKAFSPEFLNRIDDMVIFKSLQREDIHKIIDLELDKLYNRIISLGYVVKISEAAKDFIVDNGYDEKFGARPLKRAIQKFIEDPLAEEILNQDVKEGEVLIADLQEADQKIVFTKKQEPAPKKEKKPKV